MAESYFGSVGNYIYSYSNHNVFMINFEKLNMVKRWSRNRDPDEERIDEIFKTIERKRLVHGIIYLSEINEEIVCYDGMHRYSALKKYGYNKDILIDIMFNSNEKQTFLAFQNINLAVSVPDMFTDIFIDESNIKLDILELVKKYESNYKTHLSISKSPQSPNFNRDIMMDDIYYIWKERGEKDTIKNIENGLIKLNEIYKREKDRLQLSQKNLNKCEKSGFFLYYTRNAMRIDYFRLIN